jgi:hypothetical protein
VEVKTFSLEVILAQLATEAHAIEVRGLQEESIEGHFLRIVGGESLTDQEGLEVSVAWVS